MRQRSSRIATAITASVVALPLLGGCEALVYGATPAAPESPNPTVTVPQGRAPLPESAAFTGLDDRVRQVTDAAARAGATIAVQVLDRHTGQAVSNGNGSTFATASVVKVFIADDLLRREKEVSADDLTMIEAMLRSSDDDAAEILWGRGGDTAIVDRVVDRYGLAHTAPPADGRWWNTVSTAADLVRYYDMLLSGGGGLSSDRADVILSNLAHSTPDGRDGYPQRFGIPDGLPHERVAVKQGWMCCIGSDWLHVSSGVIGADQRFVMAISSRQATGDATARATLTEAVTTMFPAGRI
ncbi:serine hydrolase [Mycolicibacterium thermoresistibile]